MVKSKRASWIDASASHVPIVSQQPQVNSSTVPCPTGGGTGGTAVVTTTPIDSRQMPPTTRRRTTSISSKPDQEVSGVIPGHKSGSLSQLREQQQRSSTSSVSSGVNTMIPSSPSSPSGLNRPQSPELTTTSSLIGSGNWSHDYTDTAATTTRFSGFIFGR
ncbi:unnamed protein product [Absidia cylindrospora]